MFDSRNGHCWLVEIKYGTDRHPGSFGWSWHEYVHVMTRRQARDLARDARTDERYADVRVRRITIHGGW